MSSPTPAPNSRATAPRAPASLTERRKAATRMEIARAAAGLFVKQGLRATRAEDIALAAGVAPRTFYRYFATKEEAVAPLYAAGARRWADAVAEAPADLSVLQALEHAVRHTLTPGAGVSASSWELVRTLIRLTDTSAALRKVWAEVCHEWEGRVGLVLAERLARTGAGRSGTAVVDGAGSGGAGGVGGEVGSGGAVGDGGGGEVGSGGAVGDGGVLGSGGAGGGRGVESGDAGGVGAGGRGGDGQGRRYDAADNVGMNSGASPRLRFAAAAAGAAVRVAVEAWAVGEAPATGPTGPAAMALRNLEALRDFPWGRIAGEGP